MSYLFSEDGALQAHYVDKTGRVFILLGFRAASKNPDPKIAQEVQAAHPPASVAGCPVKLLLTDAQARDLAATVFSESSHDPTESEGILRVILNRAALSNAAFRDASFWKKVGESGIDGRSTSNYSNAKGMPLEKWTGNMKTDLQATMHGLINPVDVTDGAYFWIASYLKDRNDNIFGPGLKRTPAKPGAHKGPAFDPPIFVLTHDFGKTSFIKYNPVHPVYRSHRWP